MEDLEKKFLEGETEEENEEQVPNTDETPAPAPQEVLSPSDTSAQENENPPIVEENGATETSIKTFTQDEVDKLIGDTRIKTREKTFRYIYDRYGVNNEEEMDNLVGNAQRYDTQKEIYDSDKKAWDAERSETGNKLTEMSEQIALMQSGIDPARYEDAKLILKGKGMEVTLENINAQLDSHPEWKKSENRVEEKVDNNVVEETMPQGEENKPEMTTTRIKTLGNEPKPVPEETEEEKAEKLFKIKFH